MTSYFDYISDLVFSTATQFSDLTLTFPHLVAALCESKCKIVDGNQLDFAVPPSIADAEAYVKALIVAVDKLAKRLVERGLLRCCTEYSEQDFLFVLVNRTIKLLIIERL